MARSNFTHEFKSPINRIRGLVQILSTDTQLNGHDRVAIQALIDVNTHRLQRSAHSLLLHTFWKEQTCDLAPLDSTEWVQSVEQSIDQNHNGSETQFRFEPHVEFRSVGADLALWEIAADHLINNAVKFGGHLPVDVFLRISEEAVVLRVIDRGPGMVDVAQATAPFWQASEGLSREKNGLGLGLSLAHRIAEIHGGRLELTSQPGAGMQAILRIPNVSSKKPETHHTASGDNVQPT